MEGHMRRRRVKQTVPFEERLAQEAKSMKERAKCLPPGKEREVLLRRARQAETAAHINEWLTSPGLKSPS
jgi:hypothetical protein